MLFFLCILLLPSRRRNNLQEVIAVQSRPKFAYEIVENDLNSNQNKAKNNETEIQKGVVLRALPDYGEIRKPSANQPLAIMNDTILQTKTTIVSNNTEISLHPTAPKYDVEYEVSSMRSVSVSNLPGEENFGFEKDEELPNSPLNDEVFVESDGDDVVQIRRNTISKIPKISVDSMYLTEM